MADWTKLNGEHRGPKLGPYDAELSTSSSSSPPSKTNTGSPAANENGRRLTRQKSRESPQRKDEPRRGNASNDDLVSILANEESLVPLSRLGYENDLALVVDDESQQQPRGLRPDEDEDDSRRILDYRQQDGLEESGSRIREAARQELLREKRQNSEQLYNGCQKQQQQQQLKNSCFGEKLANGKPSGLSEDKQHHVQFQRNLLNASGAGGNEKTGLQPPLQPQQQQQQQQRPKKPSPSISTSASSSSEDNSSGDSSSLDPELAEARAPDGGWGWVVVVASFMVNCIADGITFSFGVIYHEFLEYFGEDRATTSWIGSLFMAMPLLSGPIASFLTDRYGCRKVTIAGSILATTGFVLSYFVTSLTALIFTFGVLAGFGLSLCFVAAVVIVAYYFDKRRSFATGLSVCGSGIGTFIFPPLIQQLLDEYGWRGTTLILSGLFLNLAVCGCLMRDLPWTKARAQQRRRRKGGTDRPRRNNNKRSSCDSFSASSSANTAQTLHEPKRSAGTENASLVLVEGSRPHEPPDPEKLFSSLVSLPTFVKNGEKVPLEVLELLSAKKNVYNVLLQNYPSLLISSRSFSDSSGLHEQLGQTQGSARFVPTLSPLALPDAERNDAEDVAGEGLTSDQSGNFQTRQQQQQQQATDDLAADWWLRKLSPDAQLRRSSVSEAHPRRLPTAYLKDIRMHRHSLTYRGAMLNINRYRLRASSCPDILRNSMTTIAKEKVPYSGLREFRDLLVNIFDLTHFRQPMFLLFAISNFLLHTWYDVPYMYLTDNAIEMGFSESQASYLISIIGIMNMAGEILLGWAGDRAWLNATVVYAICMALTGAFAALIPATITCYYALSSIAGLFGFFIAANYSLTSIILVKAITIERFTNAYGLLLLVQGVANLMGPPIAGWLYDVTGSYDLSFYLAGGFIAMSGAMLLVMPLLRCYRRLSAKAASRRNKDNQAPGTDFSSTGINCV